MNGANLAVTYTRMEPWTHIPRFFANGANDQDVPQDQDRIAAQYVMTAGRWVSESRFGWNLVDMDRWDAAFRVMDPNPGAPPEVAAFGRRAPWINITNLFSGPDAEIFNLHNNTWSFDQKVSRGVERHLIKMGFRWMRSSGNKLTAQNPQFQYQTLADALANIPTSINASFGTPYYNAKLDEWGGFVQDDWRLGVESRPQPRRPLRLLRADQGASDDRRARGSGEPRSRQRISERWISVRTPIRCGPTTPHLRLRREWVSRGR